MYDDANVRMEWLGSQALERRHGDNPARMSVDLLERLLDEVDYGIVLLGPRAQILLANQLARSELAREKWLRQSGECLTGAGAEATHQILHALRAAQAGRRCLISLQAKGAGMALSFVPLPGQRPAQDGDPQTPLALVSFGKRKVCEPLTLRMFGTLHKLSAAENKLLPAVSGGLSAEDIASRQGVAISTIRSQLSSIRTKTGTRSVRALMARLITLPPVRPALKRATE